MRKSFWSQGSVQALGTHHCILLTSIRWKEASVFVHFLLRKIRFFFLLLPVAYSPNNQFSKEQIVISLLICIEMFLLHERIKTIFIVTQVKTGPPIPIHLPL